MVKKGRLWDTVFGMGVKHRQPIAVGEKIPLQLDDRERELILNHTFAGEELTDRLRIVPSPGRPPSYRFTLDELEELAGYVAAEANHAKVKKLRKSCAGCTLESRTWRNPIRMSPAYPRADYQLVEYPPRDTQESENLTGNVEERTSTESSRSYTPTESPAAGAVGSAQRFSNGDYHFNNGFLTIPPGAITLRRNRWRWTPRAR